MHIYLLVAGDGDIPALLEPFADYGGEGTNEQAKFDWFKVGGMFTAGLRLKQPRKTNRFFGLFTSSTSTVIIARKSEVDLEDLLRAPPHAFLFDGRWSDSKLLPDEQQAAQWRAEFAQRLAEVPDDTTLTVVDCHS
ncbi:MAG TPA: hypothetical protein VLT36_06150 [Candidatus Dormibacteraeota bacterium]|nr:hypothetical protein [Candidatus Dormibacteraeota bacterium]